MGMILKRVLLGLVVLAVGAGLTVTMLFRHSYVKTASMYPTIPPGSMMFVSPEHKYRVGDVIEFRANGLTWAHRLVAVAPNGKMTTKGDNPQNSPDVFVPPLTQKDVIGKVVAAPRWLGFPELIWHDPSYGLSWLRFELGLGGKLVLTALVAALSSLLLIGGRRKKTDELPAPDEIDLRDVADKLGASPIDAAEAPPVTV